MVLKILLSALALLFALEETESFTLSFPSSPQTNTGLHRSYLIRTEVSPLHRQRRGHYFVTCEQRNVAFRCSENDYEEYGYERNSANRTEFVPPKLRGLLPRGIALLICSNWTDHEWECSTLIMKSHGIG
jgi:hypothetical protein